VSNQNSPAFSFHNPNYDGNWDNRKEIGGLSKLEYAAIQIMAQLMSAANSDGELTAISCKMEVEAVYSAKALFAELEKKHD